MHWAYELGTSSGEVCRGSGTIGARPIVSSGHRDDCAAVLIMRAWSQATMYYPLHISWNWGGLYYNVHCCYRHLHHTYKERTGSSHSVTLLNIKGCESCRLISQSINYIFYRNGLSFYWGKLEKRPTGFIGTLTVTQDRVAQCKAT